jgi:hypothetical protein
MKHQFTYSMLILLTAEFAPLSAEQSIAIMTPSDEETKEAFRKAIFNRLIINYRRRGVV